MFNVCIKQRRSRCQLDFEKVRRNLGLSMRMVNCMENLGATAFLFNKPGKVRLLTTGIPFWNVVKNLEFIVNKEKNFPKSIATMNHL